MDEEFARMTAAEMRRQLSIYKSELKRMARLLAEERSVKNQAIDVLRRVS
jgi:nitrate reductase assembly molybdenum cofactor insertion protein NarJ